MKNIIYPYPFKLSTTGDLSDGIVFRYHLFVKVIIKQKNAVTFTQKNAK